MRAAGDDFAVMGEETDIAPTSPEIAVQATRTVAGNSATVEEFRTFMAMLDLPIPAGQDQPRRRPGDCDLVDNAKASRHIEMLIREHGAVPARIGKAAGLSHVTIAQVMASPKSYRATVRAILAVTPEACAKQLRQKRDQQERDQHMGAKVVPADRTAEHARLLREAMTARQIAQRSGVSVDSIRAILRGARPVVKTTTEAAILGVPIPGEVAA